MKALEKDRARRYETANGLAADIQRYLNNEPVTARPPSNLYRLQKMVRRNKLAFTAAAAVLAALVSGLAVSTWRFLKEREALERAVAAEQAERKLRQEAELRELNTRAFQLTAQLLEPEAALSARKKALEAQRRLLGNEHPDVAESLEELTSIFSAIKNFPEAEKAAREALDIRRRNAPDGDLKVAQSLQKFCKTLREQQKMPEPEELYGHIGAGGRGMMAGQGKLTEAEELYREVVKIRRAVQGNENVDTAIAIHDLALVIGRQNRCAEALALHTEAFATCRKLLPDGHAVLALTGRDLFMEMIDLGQLSQAAEFARDFIPQNEKVQPELIAQVSRLVLDLSAQGRSQEVEQMLDALASKAPDSSSILRERAEFRAQRGRWKEAAADFTRVIQLKSENKVRAFRYDGDYHRLATLLIQSGDVAGYREHCRKSVEQFGTTANINSAHQLSRACATLPDSGVDPAIIGRLADASVAAGAWGPYSANKALADYRQARFASAADWAERTLANEMRPGWITLEASATLAMARHQLKQSELARTALKRAQDDAHTLAKLDSADVGPGWFGSITCNALLREAKALIEGMSETTVEKSE
jgi:tetratricopeptide (TPR) repeat protein